MRCIQCHASSWTVFALNLHLVELGCDASGMLLSSWGEVWNCQMGATGLGLHWAGFDCLAGWSLADEMQPVASFCCFGEVR